MTVVRPPFDPAARLRRKALLVLAVATVAAVVGALLPGLSPPYRYGIDKMVHVAAFAVLAFSAAMAARTLRQAFAVAVALGVLALGLEFVQLLTPDRFFSKRDALASLVGIGVGGIPGLWVRHRLLSALERRTP